MKRERPMTRNARWIVLALFATAIGLARLHTYAEPLERDMVIYATIGNGLLEGRSLYSDLWDLKPPGIYLAYAASQWIAGSGRPGIFLLNVLLPVLTMIGIARIGSSMEKRAAPASGRSVWAWTAGFWCVISGALSLEANQPNVEVFLNAGRVWVFLLLFEDDRRALSRVRVWSAAILLAITSVFKQVVVLDGLLLGGLLVLLPPGGAEARRRALETVLAMLVVGALTWAAICGYFAWHGTFADFYGAVFRYASEYSGDILTNLSAAFSREHLAPAIVYFLWPLVALWLVGVVLGARTHPRFTAALVTFTFGAWLETSLPGKFFPHYYQLWVPPLVLGGGWAISVIRSRALALGIGAAATLGLCASELPNYRLSPEEWSRRKYGEEFILTARMGRELREIFLWPGETLYNWGFDPGLYFETGISPPYGVFFCEGTYSHSVGPALQERILTELARRPPDLFVHSIDRGPPAEGPAHERLFDWVHEHYRMLDPVPRHRKFVLYALNGSPLDARWRAGSLVGP